MQSPAYNGQVLLYVLLTRSKLGCVHQAGLCTWQVSLLYVDHTQVVPGLDVVRLMLQYLAKTRLSSAQVTVVVHVNVTHQDQPLAVVRMVLCQHGTHFDKNQLLIRNNNY